jgi:LysM repeat protein
MSDRILTEIRDLLKENSRGGSTGFGRSTGGLDALPSLSNAISKATPGFETLKNVLVENIDTWRKLSNVGANFSNDVLGMSTAAAEARMSLQDFAGIVQDYSKSFSGLGIGVSRGTEAFAKLAKSLQDSSVSKDMMNLGYTTTEINELLAIQIGFQRTKFSLDKQAQDREFAAIKALATEMDLLAKLTGQSRQEMMDKLKQEQQDAAIQARIREMAQKNGIDIQTATKMYQENLLKAQSMGMEKSFKDVFASGGIRSQASAAEATAGGAAGAEVLKSALALRQGDFKASEDRMTAAMAKIVERNNQSATREMISRTGGGSEIAGPVEEAAAKQYMASIALTDAVEKLKKEKPGITTEEAVQLAFQELRKSQTGTDAEGKKVSQITEAIVETEKFYKDINASVATGIKAFRHQLDGLAVAIKNTTETIQGSKGGGNIRSSTEDLLKRGLDPNNTNKTLSENIVSGINNVGSVLSEGVIGVLNSINDGLSKTLPVEVTNFPTEKTGPTEVIAKDPLPIQAGKRATGGFIGKPEISLIGEEGPEWVLNKEQMAATLEGAVNRGLEQVSKVMPSPNIDLSSIGKDISTTFSAVKAPMSAVGRSVDFGKIGLSDQQKKVFDEMMAMSSEESKKKLENLKIEQEAAAKINSITSKQMQEMEERYEKEGKLAELESNEEYKRLNEQLNASYALSKEKKKEVEAAIQAETTRSNIVKLYGTSLDELKSSQVAAAEEIEKSAELTKTAIVGAVPVAEIKQTAADLTSGLTDLQKDFFKVLVEQDEESLKLKEGSYKKQIEADVENLKKADEEIAAVKNQIENTASETEKRRLGFKLNGLEKERAATEDAKKFAEENLKVTELAIQAKKAETTATEQVVAATDDKIQADKALDAAIAEMNANQKNAVTGKPENNSQTIEATERQRREAAQARAKQEAPKPETKKVPSINEMVQELAKASGVKDVNKIQTGQKIKLPDGTDYTVKQGDTLSKIAQQTIKDMKSKVTSPTDKPGSQARQATVEAGNVVDSKTIEATERQKREAAQSRAKQEAPKPESISSGPQQAKATLDDVVSSLDMLNRMMGQLIAVNEDLGKKQISALKSNSANLYERF